MPDKNTKQNYFAVTMVLLSCGEIVCIIIIIFQKCFFNPVSTLFNKLGHRNLNFTEIIKLNTCIYIIECQIIEVVMVLNVIKKHFRCQ